MTDETRQLEALFGPLATFSEYKRGQTIRYRADCMVKPGEITWITAPGRTSQDTEHPLEYWMGLDCIYQADSIEVLDEARDRAEDTHHKGKAL